jgi:hypothetical protein
VRDEAVRRTGGALDTPSSSPRSDDAACPGVAGGIDAVPDAIPRAEPLHPTPTAPRPMGQ